MSAGHLPDYYAILGVTLDASMDEIRQAYQQRAVHYHPDNALPATEDEGERERVYQQLADAYYVLGNTDRRTAYDRARARSNANHRQWQDAHANANRVFADAYEELLRPAVRSPGHVWRFLGGGSGATLGFIIANVPGAVVGMTLGSQLGKIRDIKGESVYDVFVKLDTKRRREVIMFIVRQVSHSDKPWWKVL